MREETKIYGYDETEKTLTVISEGFKKTVSNVTNVSTENCDALGLSEPFTKISGEVCGIKTTFSVWEGLPVIETSRSSAFFPCEIKGNHWVIRSVNLEAFTDYHDTLVRTSEMNLFHKYPLTLTGNIFFLEDYETKKSFVIISLSPDYVTPRLEIKENKIYFANDNYGVVVGECNIGECEKLLRAWARRAHKITTLHSMSNTWGDGNGFTRVKEDFIKNEIDSGEKSGVDIVQIDDGWQTGSTADKSLRDNDNHRMFIGNFWELDKLKFPNGIKPLTQYAASKGIQMGLWFAPDARDEFNLLERDKEVLRKAYYEFGIRYFKLDMVFIFTKKAYDRMLELLDTIRSFGNKDSFVELDITNTKRLGYIGSLRYGDVFVENRYSEKPTAYPHRVLRNLWCLSKFLPAACFQFEMINPMLNRDKYPENDPFVPSEYDMDYHFATVMMSNPLFWFEMQNLPSECGDKLKNIMPVWKTYRDILAKADVTPIGEKPSGRANTGFCAVSDEGNGKDVFLLIFREVNDSKEAYFNLPVALFGEYEILATNTNTVIEINGNTVKVSSDKQRSYAFIKCKRK